MLSRKQIAHRYYIKHKLIILAKKKIYNLRHSKEITVQRRKYYLKNLKKFKNLHKKYYKIHKSEIEIYRKNYYLSHRQERKIFNAKHYQMNKKCINNQRNKYFKCRKRIDGKFKLLCQLRCRISDVLRGKPKLKTTIKLVGCSIERLKLHLEAQFKPGMTWKNHGYRGWHIDHTRPCASFDFNKLKEQQECFHYTNLQPLWAEENLQKGAQYVEKR